MSIVLTQLLVPFHLDKAKRGKCHQIKSVFLTSIYSALTYLIEYAEFLPMPCLSESCCVPGVPYEDVWGTQELLVKCAQNFIKGAEH
jgi:hypothetical protein